jgi:hypothetical protein
MQEWSAVASALSAACSGAAAAVGWSVAVIVAREAFDGLDHGRADRQLRRVIRAAVPLQSGLALAAAAAAGMAAAPAAAILAALAALGFLANRWVLAPRDLPPGRRAGKVSALRTLAVSLSLLMAALAVAAAIAAALRL